MWGDTSPISGRVLANLPVASNPGEAHDDPSTAFTLVDTNVSPAQVVVLNHVSINIVHWKMKYSALIASECFLSIIKSVINIHTGILSVRADFIIDFL